MNWVLVLTQLTGPGVPQGQRWQLWKPLCTGTAHMDGLGHTDPSFLPVTLQRGLVSAAATGTTPYKRPDS